MSLLYSRSGGKQKGLQVDSCHLHRNSSLDLQSRMRSWNGSVVFPAMQWHYRCYRHWVTELKANKFQILLEILFPLMSPGSPLPVTYRHRKQLAKDFFRFLAHVGGESSAIQTPVFLLCIWLTSTVSHRTLTSYDPVGATS